MTGEPGLPLPVGARTFRPLWHIDRVQTAALAVAILS
jgi:hypothetical protein